MSISKNILIRFNPKKNKTLISKINKICSELNLKASSLWMIALNEYVNNYLKGGLK